MGSSRFHFKSNVNYDIALLSEVESLNPYAHKQEKPVWEDIASNLQNSDLKMKVTERSCRDRVELLLKDFSTEETISKRLSGVEEAEMNTIKILLTSVYKLRSDKKCQQIKGLYCKKGRDLAEETRQSALSNVSSVHINLSDDEIASDDVDNSLSNQKEVNAEDSGKRDSELPQPSNSGKRVSELPQSSNSSKRIRRPDIVSFLKQKHDNEMDFKREELTVRRMESSLEKEKFHAESEAKMMELQMNKERQAAEIKEKQALTNALLQFIKKITHSLF